MFIRVVCYNLEVGGDESDKQSVAILYKNVDDARRSFR